MFLCHPFQNLQASICLLLVIDVSSVATVPVHDLDVAVSVAPLKPPVHWSADDRATIWGFHKIYEIGNNANVGIRGFTM